MNGLVLIDKEPDFTSFDAVAVVRRIFETRKAGHGGTLDPNATGVLPVFLGNACALSSFIMEGEKIYEAEMTLGIGTDTDDIWGEVLEVAPVNCLQEEVEKAILSFRGTYDQLPPMYSAKKKNGKKLYEYARKGLEIEREAVPVKIEEIHILSLELPKARFLVRCEKGTYIRALCRDIGIKLGLPACMSSLRRLKHGPFRIEDAHTISLLRAEKEAGNDISSYLIPTEELLSGYPKAIIDKDADKRLKNGNLLYAGDFTELPKEAQAGAFLRVYDADHVFTALYQYDEKNDGFRPVRMFINGDH